MKQEYSQSFSNSDKSQSSEISEESQSSSDPDRKPSSLGWSQLSWKSEEESQSS